jgi:hypothetical protein
MASKLRPKSGQANDKKCTPRFTHDPPLIPIAAPTIAEIARETAARRARSFGPIFDSRGEPYNVPIEKGKVNFPFRHSRRPPWLHWDQLLTRYFFRLALTRCATSL